MYMNTISSIISALSQIFFRRAASSHRQTLRFNELRRRLPNVTQRMLTMQLRELEGNGLVHRRVYAEVPPRVEYSLTTCGNSLKPVIESLKFWGKNHYLSHYFYLRSNADNFLLPLQQAKPISPFARWMGA